MDLKGSNKWFDTEAVYSSAGIDHLSGFRLVANHHQKENLMHLLGQNKEWHYS